MATKTWDMQKWADGTIDVVKHISERSFENVCQVTHSHKYGETEETAKLIAAAPDLLEALEKIAKWDLPPTGKFWDIEETRPMSYEAAYGSNGSRDYIKSIAKAAIEKATK
jgi:hypothetical protein